MKARLKHLDDWNAARRERAAMYTELLPNKRVQPPAEMPYGEHVFHLYVTQSNMRDYLSAFLKEREIEQIKQTAAK